MLPLTSSFYFSGYQSRSELFLQAQSSLQSVPNAQNQAILQELEQLEGLLLELLPLPRKRKPLLSA